jgi:Ca-activated chloride channel family protein
MSRLAWALAPAAAALALLLALAVPSRPADDAGEPVELLFLYGSEKKDWLKEATEAFHAGKPTVEERPIRIQLKAMGSGEIIDELVDGERQAHLISPASGAYLEIGNARARDKGQPALVGPPRRKLVRSPVVIAMWKPMAKALGWPDKQIGWKDLHALAKAKDGWESVGYPQWGLFKFGHTHPESSNSGLITLLSEVYAATGKTKGLTAADVTAPGTAEFLKDLEGSVIHYGSSTGFFAEVMFTGDGPSFLSAAVLYENLVVQSYTDPKIRAKLPADVVCIYPREGTFWSDHPVAVVERDWVTPVHRKAAEKYIQFLLSDEQQRKALRHGFRPGVDGVAVGAPIDKAHGADPDQPGDNVLEVPSGKAMSACLELWKKHKRKSRVVLVIDASRGMIAQGKQVLAQDGAEEVIKALAPGDWLAILAFHHNKLDWLEPGRQVSAETDKKGLLQKVQLGPEGKRLLYDAIEAAYARLKQTKAPEMASAIVVLTDGGPDTGSKLEFADLRKKIRIAPDNPNAIRIYTFAYCETPEAAKEARHLQDISKDSRAKFFEGKGNPEDVRRVLRELAASF